SSASIHDAAWQSIGELAVISLDLSFAYLNIDAFCSVKGRLTTTLSELSFHHAFSQKSSYDTATLSDASFQFLFKKFDLSSLDLSDLKIQVKKDTFIALAQTLKPRKLQKLNLTSRIQGAPSRDGKEQEASSEMESK